jgi:hypothetical protein
MGAERSLRITVQRGWGREAGQLQEGKKLPDGQLLGSYGQALLALWEERGSEHTIQVLVCPLFFTILHFFSHKAIEKEQRLRAVIYISLLLWACPGWLGRYLKSRALGAAIPHPSVVTVF